MIKQIKIACQGAASLPVESLTEFQGELKSLSKEDFERLRKQIKNNGFSFPIAVWRDEGHNYVIDGHQRLRTVKKMMEEGWNCINLPVVIVDADSFQQAKEKLLAAASQYGKVEDEGLYQYLQSLSMPVEQLVENFKLPDVNLPKFIEAHFELPNTGDVNSFQTEEVPSPPLGESELRHASSHVRMVQLFFNDQTHSEFLNMVDQLSLVFSKDNLTDTLLEIVRALYQARIQNA